MTAAGIDTAPERNRAFAAAGGHEGAVVFPNLRLFVIARIDPRVDPAHFLGLDLSDAIVSRNVGGRVTPEVIDDVAFIAQIAESVLPDGPLFEVAVVHHNQCGAGALADDDFRRRYAERIGADEATLRDRAILDPRRRWCRRSKPARRSRRRPPAGGGQGKLLGSLTRSFEREGRDRIVKHLPAALMRRLRRGSHGFTIRFSVPAAVAALGSRTFDPATGQPGPPNMRPDLFMRVGSETKTFTATAVLQLVGKAASGSKTRSPST